ncbi:unnamed protein product, partial [Rotaria sordida]
PKVITKEKADEIHNGCENELESNV